MVTNYIIVTMAEITQSLLSKVVGVKRQTIYMSVKRGNLIINSANLIDTENKKNQIWIKRHGISENDIIQYLNEIQEKQKNKQKKQIKSNPIPEIREKIQKKEIEIESKAIKIIQSYKEPKLEQKQKLTINTDINKTSNEIDFENITGLPAIMMKLNIKQLVIRYGGPMLLDSWSKILQRLMSANEKDQKIQERRLELIEKDFVTARIFSFIESLSHRLFDYTETIPIEIIALVKSGDDNLEFKIKEKIRKDFSTLIRDTKENIKRELENLKKKYEKGNTNEEMAK